MRPRGVRRQLQGLRGRAGAFRGATQAAVATTPSRLPAISKKPVVTVPTGPAPTKLVTKDLVTGTGETAKAGER